MNCARIWLRAAARLTAVLVVDGDVIDFGGFAPRRARHPADGGEDVSAVFRGKQAGRGDEAHRPPRRARCVGCASARSRRSRRLRMTTSGGPDGVVLGVADETARTDEDRRA